MRSARHDVALPRALGSDRSADSSKTDHDQPYRLRPFPRRRDHRRCLGIGFAAARAFAEKGMRVAIADRDGTALKAAGQVLATLIGDDNVRTIETDVSRHKDLARLQDQVLGPLGKVHVLMNNAGMNGQRHHLRPARDLGTHPRCQSRRHRQCVLNLRGHDRPWRAGADRQHRLEAGHPPPAG